MARPILSERAAVEEGLVDMWLEECDFYGSYSSYDDNDYEDYEQFDDGWDDRAVDFDEWERGSDPLYDDWDDSSPGCGCSLCRLEGGSGEEAFG